MQRLRLTGAPYCPPRMTNPIENLNGSIAQFTRTVKRWKDGQITPRAQLLSAADRPCTKIQTSVPL